MSLYTRDRSPFYWGYLNIEGKIYKKSLKTTDRKSWKITFVWKNEIFADSLNLIDADDEEDHHHAKQKPMSMKREESATNYSGLMGAVTVLLLQFLFSAWKPSEKAKALGASVKFDLSNCNLERWQ